ncbi:MAG: response regulator transcription factor [Proteobacteria bacterium]|nr:response regulator transcription factor [Pseudomonadota bacterium]
MSVRILIADDHILVREGLRTILEAQGDMHIVGEAGDGRNALKMAEALQPDVIFMDISMPELNGIEATRMILLRLPTTKIIILSMHHTNEYVIRAMQAGARAFLLKESAGPSAVNAVRAVMRGRQYFDAGIEVPPAKRSGSLGSTKTPLESLSRRERATLQLVVEGKSNASIAELFKVSTKSVETYRSRLMLKLGISNIPALVIFALQRGVISLP